MNRLAPLLLACVTCVLAAGENEAPKTKGLPPAESATTFKVPADLQLEQVLAEPQIAQPVFLNFDERGRMWVVEFRQYPQPAGLKIVSRDFFWRNVYDKVPLPPPAGVPGADRISIHEDTDGDGKYDKHTVFLDGLNMVTAVERGRGGVWVLNPPYLLFYPDRNNDDIPDSRPEVHLQGFGLEDTHSIVNSLRWGPDGWLYGAQGSTVTANVKPPWVDQGTPSTGQLVWRYNRWNERYEIFAEGGGNAFGLELDSKGRTFSGHNGGDTRGFHYVQGGYSQKGFDKHGPLSNPYTFGYFAPMKHDKTARFTHTFVTYEGHTFPQHYRGKIFACQPLSSFIVESELIPEGSTFRTKDISEVVTTSDKWFRPVDIKLGPDGALYIADWYDGQTNHFRNNEGQIDKSNGRIYRLQAKGAVPSPPVDLGRKSSAELVALLSSENRWTRQTALRLLGDRDVLRGGGDFKHDREIPALLKKLESGTGQPALEALWALYQTGPFGSIALNTLTHSDPYVRLWTVRLLCDERKEMLSGNLAPELSAALIALAKTETNVEARNQLACTARRLPWADSLPIIRNLLGHSEDIDDKQIPLLLWWAIEAKCNSNRPAVLSLFKEAAFWELPLVKTHILERLSRRFAAEGKSEGLDACAALLKLAPGEEQKKSLLSGIEKAFEGRSMSALPIEFLEAMTKAGGDSLLLNLRLGKPEAIERALTEIANAKLKSAKRLPLIKIFGEISEPRSVPVLLAIGTQDADAALRKAALSALQRYDDGTIPSTLLAQYAKVPGDVRDAVQHVLSSRAAWALLLLSAIESGAPGIERTGISREVVDKLRLHEDAGVIAATERIWGKPKNAGVVVTEEMRAVIEKTRVAISQGGGMAKEGKLIFQKRCASCHVLFGDGGHVGPDLTAFKRDDLDTMLLSVISPNAEIREGFEAFIIKTKDGRRLTGILTQQNPQIVVLRGADGQDVTIPREQIEKMKPTGSSLMPEGVLEGLSEIELRHLFAYLRSTQPQQGK